jgi:hypothetical protein
MILAYRKARLLYQTGNLINSQSLIRNSQKFKFNLHNYTKLKINCQQILCYVFVSNGRDCSGQPMPSLRAMASVVLMPLTQKLKKIIMKAKKNLDI